MALRTARPRADAAPVSVAFGPVPSRRLGRSLGINNIPPKTCTYSCVYCQLGRTSAMRARRREFYPPAAVIAAVEAKVQEVRQRGEGIDYLAFVADGEPTLDVHLGEEIRGLRHLGPKVAVISNASLLHLEAVRSDLASADWVSLKLDAADDETWRRIDRPHRSLVRERIVAGMSAFRDAFAGALVTETMLVAGVNDGVRHVEALAALLRRLQPSIAYLAVPTRPPGDAWVRPPDEDAVHRAYQIVARDMPGVEILSGYEGNAFSATGDSAADLLAITAVHPMREEAVRELLGRNGDGWATVDRLVGDGRLLPLTCDGRRYYLRRLQ